MVSLGGVLITLTGLGGVESTQDTDTTKVILGVHGIDLITHGGQVHSHRGTHAVYVGDATLAA